MKVPKKINSIRRKIMQRLTKNIGRQTTQKNVSGNLPKMERILISRPNARLGNLLLITPLLQDVIATFPDCKIDLLVKGSLAPILFENYKNVDKIIQLPNKPFKNLGKYIGSWISIRRKKYDIVINVSKNSSSGRLSTQFSNAKFKFFGDSLQDVNRIEQIHIANIPSTILGVF